MATELYSEDVWVGTNSSKIQKIFLVEKRLDTSIFIFDCRFFMVHKLIQKEVTSTNFIFSNEHLFLISFLNFASNSKYVSSCPINKPKSY